MKPGDDPLLKALAASEAGADAAPLTGAVPVRGSVATSEDGQDTASLAGVAPVSGAYYSNTHVESSMDSSVAVEKVA
jgi:hypothetical protein